MKSKILSQYIWRELIHFECESMYYLKNPFSSDVDYLVAYEGDEDAWCTVDTANSNKPLTVILDFEATKKGLYTGRIKGIYLIELNINELKMYGGDSQIFEKTEYFEFTVPHTDLIVEVDTSMEGKSFAYAQDFKEKIIDYMCY